VRRAANPPLFNLLPNKHLKMKHELSHCPLPRRSAAALALSVSALVAGSRTWLWTFTTVGEDSAPVVLESWNSLRTRLAKDFGAFSFVRVIEPHASHRRYHLHVVVDRFLPIRRVLYYGSLVGFGLCFVKRVRDQGVGDYLSKYLAKGRRSPGLVGVRLWSRSSGDWATRCADLLYLRGGGPLVGVGHTPAERLATLQRTVRQGDIALERAYVQSLAANGPLFRESLARQYNMV